VTGSDSATTAPQLHYGPHLESANGDFDDRGANRQLSFGPDMDTFWATQTVHYDFMGRNHYLSDLMPMMPNFWSLLGTFMLYLLLHGLERAVRAAQAGDLRQEFPIARRAAVLYGGRELRAFILAAHIIATLGIKRRFLHFQRPSLLC